LYRFCSFSTATTRLSTAYTWSRENFTTALSGIAADSTNRHSETRLTAFSLISNTSFTMSWTGSLSRPRTGQGLQHQEFRTNESYHASFARYHLINDDTPARISLVGSYPSNSAAFVMSACVCSASLACRSSNSIARLGSIASRTSSAKG